MNREQFKAICRKTQNELCTYIVSKLRKKYDEIWASKDFIFAKGSVPICLVAHLDTVHKEAPLVFVEEDGKMSSPQGIGGDDRCGVYAILQIIKQHDCSVLFCYDEEIGCWGAKGFAKSALARESKFNYIIELDRKGSTDAVFYDCDNPEFENFITEDGKGFWHTQYGSYTDISEIAPATKAAAVNLSIGYYQQHTLEEYVVPAEVDRAIEEVCKLIKRSDPEKAFEYIEAEYSSWDGYGKWSAYRDYRKKGYNDCCYLISWYDEQCVERYVEYIACSEYEAVGQFLMEHPDVSFNDVTDVLNETEAYEFGTYTY